ncbi:plasmolipin-like [Helicoverpa zea]|uniref:plasmolipin-like n=1 Tax=Helicoverpa zea TaxID=7113 RepID=UPI001F59BAAF|nr:plasmolipin-like [Helicoverpa zea]XP_047041456.1 plasmolipin-like [Helicoverpa zea]
MNYNAEAPQQDRPSKIVRFDKGYVQTVPGILKLVQLACNFIGFICIKISWSWVSAIFYNILYWVGIIITAGLLFMYTFHFVEKFDRWPWYKLEFAYCILMSLTYIGCSIFASTIGESVGYAVGFFGLCAIIAYGFDAYLKYKAWKRGLPPQ